MTWRPPVEVREILLLNGSDKLNFQGVGLRNR